MSNLKEDKSLMPEEDLEEGEIKEVLSQPVNFKEKTNQIIFNSNSKN